MMARAFKPALLACTMALLAACAAQPPKHAPASVAIAAPAAPAPVATPLPAPAPPPDLWEQLRASFVLDDCANPRAQGWAKRLTRNPRLFAAKWQAALPLLAYVQETAESSNVPGEFVLLPMVESGYDPAEPGRRGDPAGMWQIMPATARALGLTVNRHYDGRLDPAASTQAVLAMLKEYNDTLHDWRLVDMAFNAGEYKMRSVMSGRGQPATDKPLHLPVGSITRNHLAKLMAMACIVRDPARYAVELPDAENATRLALVGLPQPVRLGQAAQAAGFPLARLRALNPGYRGERMPEDAPHHLLLPQENARRLAAVLDAQGAAALASTDAPRSNRIDGDSRTSAPAGAGAAAN